MRVEAEIKEVGAPYQGTARVTGKAWKSMQLLLEWEDEDGSSQAWVALFNEVMEDFVRKGLQAGDCCVANLQFSSRSYRTGYHKTDICVNFNKRKEK